MDVSKVLINIPTKIIKEIIVLQAEMKTILKQKLLKSMGLGYDRIHLK